MLNIINIIFFGLIVTADVFYILFGGLILKTVASSLFVVLGLINMIVCLTKGKYKAFSIIMFIGLVFGMLGDVVLELHFISGALLFALAHVFFFASFIKLHNFKWKDLLFGALIFVPALLIILLVPIFKFESVLMQVVCCVYALIISLMVGKALSNLIRQKSPLNLIIFIGALLFFVSDFMLLFSNFSNVFAISGILCLSTYYPAEFLLAFSINRAARCGKDKILNKYD